MRIIGSAFMIVFLLAYPERSAEAARNSIRIWGQDVVPSLFPYMVLSRQLVSRLRGGHTASGVGILLGLLGGSPSGAAALEKRARDGLSRRSLFSLCTLTGTISPMFLYGTVGGWFESRAFGGKLLASHLCAAALAAVIVYGLTPPDDKRIYPAQAYAADGNADPIRDSMFSVLSVGGCIVFFSVTADAICAILPMKGEYRAALHGILEISGGIKALSALSTSAPVKEVLCAGLCGFGGISILSQNMMFLRNMGIHTVQLFCFSLLRAALAAIVMLCIQAVFP